MKTSTFEKGNPMVSRASVLAGVLLAALSFIGASCDGGLTDDNLSEGTRCNPYASHNECGSGLVCAGYPPTVPGNGYSGIAIPFCPENYCCSVDSNGNLNSTNIWCQPGCNGGAVVQCNANMSMFPDACAFAGIDTGAPSGDDGGATE